MARLTQAELAVGHVGVVVERAAAGASTDGGTTDVGAAAFAPTGTAHAAARHALMMRRRRAGEGSTGSLPTHLGRRSAVPGSTVQDLIAEIIKSADPLAVHLE